MCEVEQPIVKGGSRDHGSVRQAVTGLEVFGVGERLGQVFRHKADGLPSQQDGQRVGSNGGGGTAFVGVNAKVYSSSAVLSGLARIIAALLPASMGLPPPMQMTALASADLPRAAASSMESVVGLGVTLSYRAMRMPCLAQAAVT